MTAVRLRTLSLLILLVMAQTAPMIAFAPDQAAPGQALEEQTPLHEANALHDIQVALVRLPLAAALGSALALRPRRRGTPPRTPAVLQTQIILAIVGAVIMLVVGASLA